MNGEKPPSNWGPWALVVGVGVVGLLAIARELIGRATRRRDRERPE